MLPLANTLECVELTRRTSRRANGKHIANVRGEIIPYIRLREHFHMRVASGRRASRSWWSKPRRAATVSWWTRCSGNCQTVIKNLGRFYRQVQVVSGATILGNGTVALILDPAPPGPGCAARNGVERAADSRCRRPSENRPRQQTAVSDTAESAERRMEKRTSCRFRIDAN